MLSVKDNFLRFTLNWLCSWFLIFLSLTGLLFTTIGLVIVLVKISKLNEISLQFYQKWQICYCSFYKNALMKWNLRLLTCLVAKAVTLCFKGFINVGYSMKVLAVKFIYEKCKTLSSFSILHKRLANLIFPKQGNSAVVLGVILMLGWVNFLGNTVLDICVYSCLYRDILHAL